MISSFDINQKAVPKDEASSYEISQKTNHRKSFKGNLIKKLKAISEQQIIGNP